MTDSNVSKPTASTPPGDKSSDTSRRQFLATTASAAAAASALGISRSAYAAENSTLKVGLVGCGGRGSGAAVQALSADPNNKLVAVGDTFKDQADLFMQRVKKIGDKDHWGKPVSEKVDVKPDHVFHGFDAYKHVVDSCDVVLFATSPHFRSIMIEYAVEKNKHIFAEKPVGTDATHLRRCKAACEKGKEKGLAIVSGLCYRYQRAKQETVKAIQDGAIGDIVSAHCYYNTGFLWHKGTKEEHPEWSDMEFQVRNWLYFNWLSGDHIVEQHIHSLDKIAWALGGYPEEVTSMGGRIRRTEKKYGDIYDHFANVYEFDNGVTVHTTCRQMSDCAMRTSDHVVGTKGTADIQRHFLRNHDGDIVFRHRSPRGRDVRPDNMYQNEHDDLFESIRKGEPIYNGDYMCDSTMMAIMARNSAYTGQKIEWDEAWESEENLAPAKYDWIDLPEPKVPVPGVTKIV